MRMLFAISKWSSGLQFSFDWPYELLQLISL